MGRGRIGRNKTRRIALTAIGAAALAFGGLTVAASGRSRPAAGQESMHAVKVSRPSRVTPYRSSQALGPNSTAANATNYTDPTGDSGNAPDVTTTSVANDDAGNLTITISLPNRPTLQSADLIFIPLDTDQTASTGSGGFDYAFIANSTGIGLFKWNGTAFAGIAAPTLTASYSNGVMTIHINRSDLSNTIGFNFGIGASGDNGATTGDFAPNSGIYSFQVVIGAATTATTGTTGTTAPTVTTTTPTATTAPPPPPPPPPLSLHKTSLKTTSAKAGTQFMATMRVTRSDTGAPLTGGGVTCSAHAGTQSLRAKKTGPKAGTATCSWLLPKTSKGKSLKGTITVSFHGKKTAGSFTKKIS